MRRISILLVMVILLQGCEHETHGFHAYFCTTSGPGSKHYLYINEVKKGELPFTKQVPDAVDAHEQGNTLYTALPPGKHSVEVRDEDGTIVFAETLKVRRRSGSTTISSTVKDPRWDTRVRIDDDQLVVELVY
jgi:hypothetical protein